jgi:hypothetical protein
MSDVVFCLTPATVPGFFMFLERLWCAPTAETPPESWGERLNISWQRRRITGLPARVIPFTAFKRTELPD